jgi:hypothetical protein
MWIDISYCAQALFLTNLNFMIFCKTWFKLAIGFLLDTGVG